MYQNLWMDKIEFTPIGIVRREDPNKQGDMEVLRRSIAIIEVFPEYVDGLKHIEENSFIWVLWFAHLSRDTDILEVHPMGDVSRPKIGVFASRSPLRVNNIMLSLVRLIERRGSILRVVGLDAYDGSPVIDIKPYSPSLDDPGHLCFDD